MDADSTYKPAILLYGAYIHRIGLSLRKKDVLNEALQVFCTSFFVALKLLNPLHKMLKSHDFQRVY